MVKKRLKKCTKTLAVAMMSAMCLMSAGGMTVYANADQASIEAAESEAQDSENVIIPVETEASEEQVIDRGQEFSVPGNGEVLDNIKDDPNKEFYTIRTENNNTFYLVIDKGATSDNVYMLSMVDEADLKEFLPAGENGEAETPSLPVIVEENKESETQTEVVKPDNGKQQNKLGSLVVIGTIALAGLGGYFFWKRKKKDSEFEIASENLEYDDGLEVINEDEGTEE